MKPTIENRKNLENSTRLKILSIHSNNMRNGAKTIYNTYSLRFQQYFMHMKSSGTQNFNLNISHIGIFAENQRISILLFLKINFHFYSPNIFSSQSMEFRLSKTFSTIKLSFLGKSRTSFFSCFSCISQKL